MTPTTRPWVKSTQRLSPTTGPHESPTLMTGLTMSSISGLEKRHRVVARRSIYNAAWLTYSNRTRVHYTQGGQRWQGIADTRYSERNQYPNYCDCSSFATWCLWNGLYVPYKVHDVVNGA